MDKSKQTAAKAGGIKRNPPPPNTETLRRAHAALHRFAEWLDQELDDAIHCARARQLAPLRHILQVCRYLHRRYSPSVGGPAVSRPSHLTIEENLPEGLRLIDAGELTECLADLAKLAEELAPFEGRQFARKPISVGTRAESAARQRSQPPSRPDEETVLAELERAAARLVEIFRTAVVDLAEAASSEPPKAAPAVDERVCYSPPKLAKKLGVGVDKIYVWIRNGTLSAVDASKRRGGRPRFMISQEAVDEMMRKRSVSEAITSTKPRRKVGGTDGVIKFF